MIDVVLHDNTKQLDKMIQQALQETMKKIGEAGVVEWQFEIRKQHAIRTGRYLNSINYAVTDTNIVYIGTAIGINDDLPEYPTFLEYGTSRIAPRNIAHNAMDRLEKKIEGITIEVFARIFE